MKRLQRFIIIVFLPVAAILNTAVSASGKNYQGWKAGIAGVVITPDRPMWMAGYGDRDRPSEGKITDIWAKALVLQDAEGRQAVLITADLVGIPKRLSDHVRNLLKAKYNLSRSQIAINTSHTHTGPVLSEALVSIYPVNENQQKDIDRYTDQLGEKLVFLVGNALQSMQPAQLYSGNGVTRFQVNRRNNVEATLTLQSDLNGPNDYAVPVIKVADKNGKLIAVAFGYACHNTVLAGYKWSGDYAGFAQEELEKTYPGVVAFFLQGCGADQNPLPRRTVQLARQYGKTLAAAVDRVLNEEMKPLSPRLTTAYSEVALPLSAPPTKTELSKIVETSSGYKKRWAENLISRINSGQPLRTSYPYPVEVWKIGEQPVIILGGEVVVGYAVELKRILGEDIFVLGYSNDVMAYIPTATILREGGYEGASSQMVYGLPSPWKADIETIILQEVLQLTKQAGIPIPDQKIREKADSLPGAGLLSYTDDNGNTKPVRTSNEWQVRRRQVLDSMQAAMGKLPSRKHLPPLNIQVIDSLKTRSYVRYNIRFTVAAHETLPAFLYIPVQPGKKKKLPAMLALHPTGDLGKKIVDGQGGPENLAYAKELAERGYVVIAPDYPSFGDLKEYDFKTDRYQSGTIKGIFDNMRCIDLLQSRPDVDPDKIGVIGHSLGGHNAIFAGAFDTRLKVIVSSCGWTLMHDYFNGDTATARKYGGKLWPWAQERYMPLIRDKYGLDPDKIPFDFDEVIASIAPRAFFSNSPLNDANFNLSGIKKGIANIAQVYSFMKVPGNLQIRYPDSGHDFPFQVRWQAYHFIDSVFGLAPKTTTGYSYADNPHYFKRMERRNFKNIKRSPFE